MMRTANPALNENIFVGARAYGREETMTLQGTVNKTFALLALVILAAWWVWGQIIPRDFVEGQAAGTSTNVGLFMLAGIIGGFIFGLITAFKKEWAAVTAPIYSLCQGLALGGISAFFELQFPGIVVQAVALTFGTLFCLLLAYKSGLVKATENFKLGVAAATGGIAILYFVSIILGFFHIQIPFIFTSSVWGIGFSVFVVIVAALNLVLDFDFIEQGASSGASKYMEWYGAFGLMVTLIWLYLEILRLLAKLRERR